LKPVIAIVGRPNVGKSTLYNRLTHTRDALVADMPGVTRDRLYGQVEYQENGYIIIDTGGLSGENAGIEASMIEQVFVAIDEADIVFFLVDAREGLTPYDQTIAGQLRTRNKPIFILVNKSEGLQNSIIEADFFSLGLGQPVAISASHGKGISGLMDEVIAAHPYPLQDEDLDNKALRLAVIGRPNVGKSTLINRMIGEERLIAFDMPGTTRDSVMVPFEKDGQRYTFIDTAGVRKRSRVKDTLEKFSVIKALQAIDLANVVILVIDARDGITDQDLTLLGMVLQSGRALVISVNKWDGLDKDVKDHIKRELERRLHFLNFAKIHFISALHGSGVGLLFETVNLAFASAMKQFQTSQLTDLLEHAVQMHQPPMVHGRRIKMIYAHQGGQNPPLIVVHGRQLDKVPDVYTRYLIKHFMKFLKLQGTPLKIQYKQSENPYAGQKKKDNRSESQLFKRRRHTRQLIKKYGGKKDKRQSSRK